MICSGHVSSGLHFSWFSAGAGQPGLARQAAAAGAVQELSLDLYTLNWHSAAGLLSLGHCLEISREQLREFATPLLCILT